MSGFEKNPKQQKRIHLDSKMASDNEKANKNIRKFECQECQFKSSSQIKFNNHKISRHVPNNDTIEDSNRPLITKDGQLTRLSLEVKQEIVTNHHAKIGFNEDDVMVIDY